MKLIHRCRFFCQRVALISTFAVCILIAQNSRGMITSIWAKEIM